MERFYYDLHVHSCLSPCADNDNTPFNIAGMASLCELDIVALTDHNTCKNCPSFFEAANGYGISPVAGMELTTSEDIHIVCLFDELEPAMKFDEDIHTRRILIKNKAHIFGDQLIIGYEDEVTGTDEYLLSNATTVSVEDVIPLVEKYGGVCYPAHIDRMSNGIIAVLGTLPESLPFTSVELHSSDNIEEYYGKYKLNDKRVIGSSDAHCLTDLDDRRNSVTLNANRDEPSAVRRALLDYLRGK